MQMMKEHVNVEIDCYDVACQLRFVNTNSETLTVQCDLLDLCESGGGFRSLALICQ